MRTLILLVLVLAGACSRSETSEPVEITPEPSPKETAKPEEKAPAAQPTEASAAEEEDQQEAAPAVDLGAPPKVELVDAGKAPRKALRTRFEVGAKQSLQIESEWTIETVYGPLIKTKALMPSLVYELKTEVADVSSEGALFRFKVASVAPTARDGVKPAQVEAAKEVADSLKGATGSFRVNARGIVEEFEIDVSANTSLLLSDMVDQIKQALRLSSLPLPEEPVGKGAKWTATQVIEQRTARFRHTSTFELASVEGEIVRASSTHAAETAPQTLQLPGNRPDVQFQLQELDFFGDTKGGWRLDRLGPPSASEHTLSGFKMTATAPKPEVVVMALDVNLELTTKP